MVQFKDGCSAKTECLQMSIKCDIDVGFESCFVIDVFFNIVSDLVILIGPCTSKYCISKLFYVKRHTRHTQLFYSGVLKEKREQLSGHNGTFFICIVIVLPRMFLTMLPV